MKQTAAELICILAKNDENFLSEYLDFTRQLVNGVNIRTQKPADDLLKEAVLFGVEKSIQSIIDDLDRKMD